MERIISFEEEIVAAQEEILKQSGLWATPELKAKYAFRLSPDALAISPGEKSELEEISSVLYLSNGFFEGAIKLYQKTLDPRFASTPVGSIVRRGLTNGIPKSEIAIQGTSSEVPALSRVDLIKTQNQEGSKSFQIAEIEGDKTHGFGYLTLMDYFRKEFIGRQDTKGVINTLKELLSQKGIDSQQPIIVIVGESERFYLGELEVFSDFCRVNGVNLFTAPERDILVTNEGVAAKGISESNVLLNLPSLTPLGDKGSGVEGDKIFKMFTEGKITCLIPPNRFLGSKGLLAIVSNGDNNEELENVLREVFDPAILDKIRNYLPETILITKKNKKGLEKILLEEPDEWVIKKVVSSGMKGVALPSDKEKLASFTKTALESPFNFVIQRKVNQITEIFKFSELGSTFIQSAPMYMRVELFASPIGLATVGVTGREVPSVHGAADAIQIPIVYK